MWDNKREATANAHFTLYFKLPLEPESVVTCMHAAVSEQLLFIFLFNFFFFDESEHIKTTPSLRSLGP